MPRNLSVVPHEESDIDILETTPLIQNPSSLQIHDLRVLLISNNDNIKFVFCIIIGMLVSTIQNDKLSTSAIQTSAVFLTVILSLMVTNYPISIIVCSALAALVLLKSLMCQTESSGLWILCNKCSATMKCDALKDGFKTSLLGYSNPIAWMILCAFMIGQAVDKTGLGKRLSLLLMKHLGGNLLGLGYAIFISEFVLSAFIPSNTARGGGIIMPIVMSLIETLGSTPEQNVNIGKFLILCGAHSNLLSSTFFITAAGPNPIIVELAHKILNINYSFATWFSAAVLPGLVSILIIPPLLFYLYSPKYDGRNVISEADSQLKLMGQTTIKELKLLGILLISLLLWSTGKITSIPETLIAYLAFVSLLLVGVLNWKDISSNHVAWDTYFWLAGMLTLADQLSRLGVASYFGELSATYIIQYTDSTITAALLLCLSYCFSMYFFSSITGHAIAIGGPLMAAGKSIGCSSWLVTALMACFSSLSACLTTFSTGSVVLYYSKGYFTQGRWFLVGHLVIAVYFLLYGTLGMVWWKVLSFY